MKTIFIFLLHTVFFYQVWLTHGREAEIKKNGTIFRTFLTTKDITNNTDASSEQESSYRRTYIDIQVHDKPHNLFIGRCARHEKELHREHIVLNNDGKSHVSGHIRVNVNAPVDITCVKVTDEAPGSGAYPAYVGGGVGFNFVEIGVTTRYGQGFKFFLQIFGTFTSEDSDANRT